MKNLSFFVLALGSLIGFSGEVQGQELQVILEKNIKYSHDEENWYPSLSVALDGLTADQSNWKDNSGNHSISQLVSHLVFWNGRMLKTMKGEDVAQFDGNNDNTFTNFTQEEFNTLTRQLDTILSSIEEVSRSFTKEEIENWAPTLANIASHNAYHTGQIVYIRKQKGWWR